MLLGLCVGITCEQPMRCPAPAHGGRCPDSGRSARRSCGRPLPARRRIAAHRRRRFHGGTPRCSPSRGARAGCPGAGGCGRPRIPRTRRHCHDAGTQASTIAAPRSRPGTRWHGRLAGSGREERRSRRRASPPDRPANSHRPLPIGTTEPSAITPRNATSATSPASELAALGPGDVRRIDRMDTSRGG